MAPLSPWSITVIRHRARILSLFLLSQLAVQAMGFAAGIVIVRSLSASDYALYTIAGSMLGFLTGLADSGTSNALLALGGKCWESATRLGNLIRAAVQLRWRLLGYGALAALAPYVWLALRADATLNQVVLLITLVLLSSIAQLYYTIHTVVLKLHSRIAALQGLEFFGGSLRFVLLLFASYTFLGIIVALSINFAAGAIQAITARRWSADFIAASTVAHDGERSQIMALVRSQIPNALFFALYSQATVLAIAVFGRVREIAEVGALGRLAVIFNLFGAILSMIMLPRFARARTRRALLKQYTEVMSAFGVMAFGLSSAALIFPKELVWVLGEKYANLDELIGVLVATSLISIFVGLVWHLNAAQGWVRGAWQTIPCVLAGQIIAAFAFDLASVRGVLLFGSVPLLAALIVLWRLTKAGISAAADQTA